jgi:hypothetical protein
MDVQILYLLCVQQEKCKINFSARDFKSMKYETQLLNAR